MEKYDYCRTTIDNIKKYIKNNPQEWADPKETDNFFDYWYDILWEKDTVTGNGPNWYSTETECEEFLCHNIEMALEACNEFCVDRKSLISAVANGTVARYIDCTIRCFLLGECLSVALEELHNEME